MRYCPPIYVLCVSSHLWTVPRQIKFWAILIKSWDWRDPPPPSLGQNPKFTQKKVWTAPLTWLGGQQKNKGSRPIFFWVNLGFCPNRLDPLPSPNVGTPTTKKKFWCLFCILGYSKHIIFSWKSPIFWLKRVGTGAPPTPLIWILSAFFSPIF